MPDHIITAFDADLGGLRHAIAEMGGIAEKMLADSTTALVRDDASLAQGVIEIDSRLDALQRDIEERSILIIARRQPMAADLRAIVASMRSAGALERAGGLAKSAAKRGLAMTGHTHPRRVVAGVSHMSDLAARQLKEVLDAYAADDVEAAKVVWNR